MELSEALEIAVARTGVARFRQLLDPTHAAFNPAYESVVRRIALGKTPHVPIAMGDANPVVVRPIVTRDVPMVWLASPAGLQGALDRWWVESVHNHREERRRKDAEELGLPYVKRCCGQT